MCQPTAFWLVLLCLFQWFMCVCFFKVYIFLLLGSLIRLTNSHGIDDKKGRILRMKNARCLHIHYKQLEIIARFAFWDNVCLNWFQLFRFRIIQKWNLEYVRAIRTPFILAISCWYKLAIWYLTFIIKYVILVTTNQFEWNKPKKIRSLIIEMKAKVCFK